jgi:hypothetical protein
MNSPPHRANILDPELDSLGVAVVERNGELFAVQDFALASKNSSRNTSVLSLCREPSRMTTP